MERVMITIPKDLLARVDLAARDLGENRSQFVRQALIDRMERKAKEEFEALLAEGYHEMHDDLIEIAKDFEMAQAKVWATIPWDD